MNQRELQETIWILLSCGLAERALHHFATVGALHLIHPANLPTTLCTYASSGINRLIYPKTAAFVKLLQRSVLTSPQFLAAPLH